MLGRYGGAWGVAWIVIWCGVVWVQVYFVIVAAGTGINLFVIQRCVAGR